jgi:hypothetical protein
MAQVVVRRVGEALVLLSWLAFLASFCLPATNILEAAGTKPGTPLTGWQAFSASLGAGAWLWLADPRLLWLLVFPVTNVLMLAAPAFCLLREGALIPAVILAPAAFGPWVLPPELLGDSYVGFYVWIGSYIGAALGCFLVGLSHLGDDFDD